ncbi:hypothetical protein [Nocardia camponoti]|uniref:Uncharacterized protein n=1 Tax=Nocardia camponoti TaxID=1616106 RepID=A0A917QLF7_9NOCA|nr:hypothetical protein [Nocardia camponoti]GGK56334.1 hypothetical protein GCM10011591_30490 [Nocardia camponoti]
MEPIEINAGAWYLRALRADRRIDDRPALADGGVTDPDYVATRSAQWADESHFSWAVCVPTTAELVAEIGVTPSPDGTAAVSGWARTGFDDALATGLESVTRFVAGALGLTPVPASDSP